ncbi:MAG: methionyl-tRNA formyltransferase, partial [Bacteroidales bacterium]|nr:methionyl-tRNA formyltransferase [Bacteroidales bacterium]
DQSEMIKPGLPMKTAPKIFTQDCRIDWDRPVQAVYDHVRGLSPYPTAWTILRTTAGKELILKIFTSEKEKTTARHAPCTLLSDGKTGFGVACRDGILHITELQVEGKKKMGIGEFIKGVQDLTQYSIK